MATVLVLFFSNSFVFSEFMRAWEGPVVKDEDIHKTYDYGIVVVGMLAYDRADRRINFKRVLTGFCTPSNFITHEKSRKYSLQAGLEV